MNWRFLVVAVMTVMTVVGCSVTVAGTPERVTEGPASSERGYGYASDRCGLLSDGTVQGVVGADKLLRPYSGAVCQYVLTRHSTFVDVVYSWFETGSLERERALAQTNKAQITEMVVQRRQGFVARQSAGDACSATAATNPGVATWWVQARGAGGFDPCGVAQALLDKTLSAEL